MYIILLSTVDINFLLVYDFLANRQNGGTLYSRALSYLSQIRLFKYFVQKLGIVVCERTTGQQLGNGGQLEELRRGPG